MLNSSNFRLKKPSFIGGGIVGFEVKKCFGNCDGSSEASRLASVSGFSLSCCTALLLNDLAGNRFGELWISGRVTEAKLTYNLW
mmetsp:Transcript_60509/g.126635  ORF Transcript_60509/g.126635 Transcript_60509/m.126635 type:complete len:84 (-) Transcript_60509:72-323(-)